MSIVLDILIILIFVASVYTGYKKGIINVGFNLFAFIIAIIVAVILYRPITNIIVNNTGIDESIEKIIIENGVKEKTEENKQTGIDSFVQNYAKDIAQGTQNAIVESAARPIAIKVIAIAIMILLFIIARIILIVLKVFTNLLAKLPILKQCNEIVGLIYGILKGLIIIYAILAIVFFISTISGNATLNTIVEKTYITKIFYNHNLILDLLF